jgi:hypothetical protein
MVIVFLGMTIGICLSPVFPNHSQRTEIVRDTTVIVQERYYSRPALTAATLKLDLSRYDNLKVPSVVYVPEEKIRIEVRDCVRYVVLPRELNYTEMGGVKIWHSGVDSTIDSLRVTEREYVIDNIYHEKRRKNTIGIGLEGNYTDMFRMPFQVEYSRRVLPWLSVYAYGEYELFSKQIGAGAGARAELSW